MVDINKTLVTLRESFQRNIGIEVLFEDKTLELIPHRLIKEANGDIVLLASLDGYSEPDKYLVKNIQGVKLDVATGVPSTLSWDEDYVNSRSFLLTEQTKNSTVKLDFSNEPDVIDTSIPKNTRKKKSKNLQVKTVKKNSSEIKSTTFKHNPKNRAVVDANKLAHSKKGYWITISILAVIVFVFVAKPFEWNFTPSEEEQLASEYEEWIKADGDKDSVWKQEQDILLDNSAIKGKYSKYDNISWRLPVSYDNPNGWYRGFDLRKELEDKIDVNSLIETAKENDIYSSLMNDWSPYKEEEDESPQLYWDTTYYQSYYSPERKCTIWHNDMNPILLSKERISELGYEKDDLGLTRYYAKEIISKLSDDPDVTPLEETNSVYLDSSRYKMESLNYSFDNINLTVRAFSERGTVLYIYNDCGLSIDELEEDSDFIIEVSGYPYILSDNNPVQPESILRR